MQAAGVLLCLSAAGSDQELLPIPLLRPIFCRRPKKVEEIRRLKEKQESELQEKLLKLGTSCLLFEEDQNSMEIERMYYGDSDEVKR